MKGVASTIQTLTSDERKQVINDALGDRFEHSGKLLLPDYATYEGLTSDEGLSNAGKKLLRWIGVKPRRLTISYTDLQNSSQYSIDEHAIRINRKFIEHPHAAGGVLALAVIDFILQQKNPDIATKEYATLQLGLGLWVLNALKPRLSLAETTLHILDASWHALEGIQLGHYTNNEYARAFTGYVWDNRLPVDSFEKGCSERTRYLLGNSAQHLTKSISEPTATIAHRHAARLYAVKLLLTGIIIAGTLCVLLLLLAVHQHTDTQQQEADFAHVTALQEQLNTCLNEAQQAQDNYNPDDFDSAEYVESEKLRCQSLRNQYDHASREYQQNYITE